MKKIILGLGTVIATTAPIAAVIACGSSSNSTNVKEITVSGNNAIVTLNKESEKVNVAGTNFGTGDEGSLISKAAFYINQLFTSHKSDIHEVTVHFEGTNNIKYAVDYKLQQVDYSKTSSASDASAWETILKSASRSAIRQFNWSF